GGIGGDVLDVEVVPDDADPERERRHRQAAAERKGGAPDDAGQRRVPLPAPGGDQRGRAEGDEEREPEHGLSEEGHGAADPALARNSSRIIRCSAYSGRPRASSDSARRRYAAYTGWSRTVSRSQRKAMPRATYPRRCVESCARIESPKARAPAASPRWSLMRAAWKRWSAVTVSSIS